MLAVDGCTADRRIYFHLYKAEPPRGGYAVMAADLILLPVFLLLRKRKRAAAEPDKEG
ncbi:MAG: hypothetical protein IKX57_08410 [Oscillospiraceae bacterium]|nr:hypothetical protein [Oscillospiraceae bacterium]